jgi:hypothetical protein
MNSEILLTESFGSAIANDAYWWNIQEPVKVVFIRLMQAIDHLSLNSNRTDNYFTSLRKESDSYARITNEKVPIYICSYIRTYTYVCVFINTYRYAYICECMYMYIYI